MKNFEAGAVVENLPDCTVMMGVPTFYTRLLAEPNFTAQCCARMRLFISGSAPLRAETFVAFERRTGHRILERYGMTETGMNTELGQIASAIQNIEREATPLQQRLDQLGGVLAIAILVLVLTIFSLGLLRGEEIKLMFLMAVSLAVAAIPEGLPAVVTIALALGAQRMLKRRSLIRKFLAIQIDASTT